MNSYEIDPDKTVMAPEAKVLDQIRRKPGPAKGTPAPRRVVDAVPEAPAKPNLRYQRDKMREKVKGIFKFDEAPGQTLSFMYREFREDPIERYDLKDGSVCTLPLGVARHINKNMFYPIHEHTQDEYGSPSFRIGHRVQRASFQSLEFVDIEDFEPAARSGLVTVERI